jgi:hypothetical protein
MHLSYRPQRTPLVAPGAIDHHIADLTVTASADVTLAALQQKLSERDQWLPIDGDPSLSLGQLVETNSTGPLRLGFGAWRDLLLGCQFLTPSGKLITAGGRTMKNVAGYDLSKFMVGQHGVFGSVVTITTRTYKRPAGALLARFTLSNDLVGKLLPTPARPHWAMISDGALWCGYFGDEKAFAIYESDLPRRGATQLKRMSLQEDIDFRAERWLPARPPTKFRASVPPVRILNFIEKAQLQSFAADPAFGISVGLCDNEHRGALIQIAQEMGGQVFFEDPADIRNFHNVVGVQRAILERLESAFRA